MRPGWPLAHEPGIDGRPPAPFPARSHGNRQWTGALVGQRGRAVA